ncbi:MAG: cytochrome C, partial [Acidobacteria bacterium]
KLDNRRRANKLEEICEEISSGAMPQGKYVLLHPDAKLSRQDIDAICGWTDSTRAALEEQPR